MGVGPAPRLDAEGDPPRGGEAGPLTIKERRRLNPSRSANLLIALAVRALPPAHRERYMREFYGEMFGMSRARQVGFGLALVAHSTGLALALDEPDPTADVSSRRDWRCALHRHHYVTRNNPDAETRQAAFYEQCARCGRIRDRHPSGYTTPIAG